MVPICSLAGVLVFTGFNLIKVKDMRHLASYGRIPLLIYAATLITIVTTDLLTGVLVGVTLSVLKLLYKTTHLQVYTEPYSNTEGHIDLHLNGSATFVRIPLIAATLESIPEGSTVHVRTENLYYIDHSCLDLMHDWIKTGPSKNLRIVMESDLLERKYREFATT
jgi:MFS superfamily sulfate permease-like transporter